MNLAFSLHSPALVLPASEAKRLSVVKGGILFPAVYLPEGSEKFVSEKKKQTVRELARTTPAAILLLRYTCEPLMLRLK